ncbi:MAG: hypothetical protein WC986_14820 [Elusimicrobiota bacterium]|jgi:hypothetical protein
MKPKCPYGRLKKPIGRRVCKRRPFGSGRRKTPRHSRQRGKPEVNDLFLSRPTRVEDDRMFWDDGSHMDLPL